MTHKNSPERSNYIIHDSVTLNPILFTPRLIGFLEDNDFVMVNSLGYASLDELIDSNPQIFPGDFERLIYKCLGLLLNSGEYTRLKTRQKQLKDLMLGMFQNERQFVEDVAKDMNLFLRLYAGTFKVRIILYTVGRDGVSTHIFGDKTFENKVRILADKNYFFVVEKSQRQLLDPSLLAPPVRPQDRDSHQIDSPEKTIREIYEQLVLIPLEFRPKRERDRDNSVNFRDSERQNGVRGNTDSNDPSRRNNAERGNVVSTRVSNNYRGASSLYLGIERDVSGIEKKWHSFELPTSPDFSPERSTIARSPSSPARSPHLPSSFSPNNSPRRNPLRMKPALNLKTVAQGKKEAGAERDNKSPGINLSSHDKKETRSNRSIAKVRRVSSKDDNNLLDKDSIDKKHGTANLTSKNNNNNKDDSENLRLEENEKEEEDEEEEGLSGEDDEMDAVEHSGVLESYSATKKYGFITTKDNRRAIVLYEELERAGAASRLPDDSRDDLTFKVHCGLQRLNGANLRIYEAVNVQFL